MSEAPDAGPDRSLRRPRSRRWRLGRREEALPVPDVEEILAVPERSEGSFAELPALAAEFARRGLDARLDDRTAGFPVPVATQQLIYKLVEDGYASAHGQHAAGQAVHTRLRIDGSEVVLSAQTYGLAATTPSYTPNQEHRAQLHARVEAAGGRSTIRQTPDGNWLVIIRLPL